MKLYLYDNDITFNDSYIVEGKMYFSCNTLNGLFCYDYEKESLAWVGMFPGEKVLAANLHQRVFEYKGKLYFAPYNATHISVYDYTNGVFDSIEVGQSPARGMDALLYNEVLWIFYSNKEHSVICINLENRQVTSLPTYEEMAGKSTFEKQSAALYSSISYDGQFVWGVFWGTDKLFKIDVNDKTWEVISLDKKDLHLKGVAVVGNDIFLLATESRIYKMKLGKKGLAEIEKADQSAYVDIINCNGSVVLLPVYGRTVDVISDDRKNVYQLAKLPEEFSLIHSDDRNNWRSFMFHKCEGDMIWLSPYRGNMMLSISLSNRQCNGQSWCFPDAMLDELWEKHYFNEYVKEEQKKRYIEESEYFSLDGFIDRIGRKN